MIFLINPVFIPAQAGMKTSFYIPQSICTAQIV